MHLSHPPSQQEAALAAFTQRLKNFRPAATVLEAEIAKVRQTALLLLFLLCCRCLVHMLHVICCVL